MSETYAQPQAVYQPPDEVEEEEAETIDYWSIEAHLRGWHGDAMRRKAQRFIRERPVNPKTTRMRSYW